MNQPQSLIRLFRLQARPKSCHFVLFCNYCKSQPCSGPTSFNFRKICTNTYLYTNAVGLSPRELVLIMYIFGQIDMERIQKSCTHAENTCLSTMLGEGESVRGGNMWSTDFTISIYHCSSSVKILFSLLSYFLRFWLHTTKQATPKSTQAYCACLLRGTIALTNLLSSVLIN